jgi:hypothetical protein
MPTLHNLIILLFFSELHSTSEKLAYTLLICVGTSLSLMIYGIS